MRPGIGTRQRHGKFGIIRRLYEQNLARDSCFATYVTKTIHVCALPCLPRARWIDGIVLACRESSFQLWRMLRQKGDNESRLTFPNSEATVFAGTVARS